MEKKFILMIAMLALVFTLFTATNVQAAECSRSGATMLITYSPSDLNVGEEFNLTYYDLFGGANEQATLNYPSALVNLGSDTVALSDDGFGGGYWTWQMNSTTPGNHTVYVNISYEEGGCNITRIIEIQPSVNAPNIILSYVSAPGNIIANQNKAFGLLISNTGIGAAYNVNGWTNLGSVGVIGSFSYGTIEAGNVTTKNFNINTDVCSISTLESTANYEDNFGYNYPPSHVSTSINVIGSDLEITDFDVSDTSVKKGKTLRFDVTVENKDRNTTINATDAVVKIYRNDDLIETIDLGDIDAGQTASGEGSWKVTGKTGKVTIKAVVDSDNECSNWDNDETVKVKVLEDEDEEEIWPEPEEEEEEEEEPTIPTTPGEEAEEEGLGAMATVAIVLEVIALALVIIYLAKRKKRRKRIKQPKVKAK